MWFRAPEITKPPSATLLLAALLFFIAFRAARSYVRLRSPVFLLLGSGIFALGMGNLLGWGRVLYGENFANTVYGTSALLGGFDHLSGIALLILGPSAKRQTSGRGAALKCISVYLATMLFLLVVSLLTVEGSFQLSLHNRKAQPWFGR